jgi:Tfp pilus assembly protein FimT
MKLAFNKTKTIISKPKFTTGFTLIETLLVVGIIVVVFSFSVPYGLNFYKNQLVNETQINIIDALERARHSAILQKNDSNFGLALNKIENSNSYVVFQGADYDNRVTDQDDIYPVISEVVFSGLGEVVFSKLTGLPSATGTIVITYGEVFRSVIINDSGLASKN